MKLPTMSDAETRSELALLALPILVDRLGGTVDITRADLDALAARFGGIRNVAVRIAKVPGGFRYALGRAPERPSLS